MKTKHVPERTCAACGTKKPQRELLRVAAQSGGAPRLDDKEKAPGRGAYLCMSAVCVEMAWKRKALERSLKLGQPAGRELKDELLRAIETRQEGTAGRESTSGV